MFFVEELIRQRTEDGRYLVKWEGFPETENSWEPAANLPPHLVDKFRGRGLVSAKPIKKKPTDDQLAKMWTLKGGRLHPNTLACLSNLAVARFERGEHSLAIKDFRQILQAREQTQGALHSETVTARSNLEAAVQMAEAQCTGADSEAEQAAAAETIPNAARSSKRKKPSKRKRPSVVPDADPSARGPVRVATVSPPASDGSRFGVLAELDENVAVAIERRSLPATKKARGRPTDTAAAVTPPTVVPRPTLVQLERGMGFRVECREPGCRFAHWMYKQPGFPTPTPADAVAQYTEHYREAHSPMSPAKCADSGEGSAAELNRRVTVRFDEGTFGGRIAEYQPATNQYLIEYDDGASEWTALPDKDVTVLPATSVTSASPAGTHCGGEQTRAAAAFLGPTPTTPPKALEGESMVTSPSAPQRKPPKTSTSIFAEAQLQPLLPTAVRNVHPFLFPPGTVFPQQAYQMGLGGPYLFPHGVPLGPCWHFNVNGPGNPKAATASTTGHLQPLTKP